LAQSHSTTYNTRHLYWYEYFPIVGVAAKSKKNVTPNIMTTLSIVFVDGIVTGLLIQFICLQHALSVGIGGLFLLVYVKAFSAMTYAAIFGVTSALLTAGLTSFPTCNLETSMEILLLVMMGGFLLAFCLISGHQDKRLNEKL
jgi:hypothetical protein